MSDAVFFVLQRLFHDIRARLVPQIGDHSARIENGDYLRSPSSEISSRLRRANASLLVETRAYLPRAFFRGGRAFSAFSRYVLNWT